MVSKDMFETVVVGGFNKLEVIKYIEVANSEKESVTKKLYEEKENNKKLSDDINSIVKKSSEVEEEINKNEIELQELQKKVRLFMKEEEEILEEINLLETKISIDTNNKDMIYSTSEDVGKIIIEANVIADKMNEECDLKTQNMLQNAMIEANDMIENEEEKAEEIKFNINENLSTIRLLADEIKDEYDRMNLYFKSALKNGLRAIDEIIEFKADSVDDSIEDMVKEPLELIELQHNELVEKQRDLINII